MVVSVCVNSMMRDIPRPQKISKMSPNINPPPPSPPKRLNVIVAFYQQIFYNTLLIQELIPKK